MRDTRRLRVHCLHHSPHPVWIIPPTSSPPLDRPFNLITNTYTKNKRGTLRIGNVGPTVFALARGTLHDITYRQVCLRLYQHNSRGRMVNEHKTAVSEDCYEEAVNIAILKYFDHFSLETLFNM